MMLRLGALLSLGAVGLGKLAYVEPSQCSALQDVSQPVNISGEGVLVDVVYSLLGLQQQSLPEEHIKQVAQIARGSQSEAQAKGAVLLTVSGVSPDLEDSLQQQVQLGRRAVELVGSPKLSATEVLDSVTRVGATGAIVEPEITLLGSAYPSECKGSCQTNALKHLATSMGYQYTPGKEDLSGTFTREGAPPLGLTSSSVKLWALELAATNYHALRMVVQRQKGGQPLPQQARHVLEATLVGLQAVRQEHGDASEITRAVAQATGRVLDSIMGGLEHVFDSHVVFQVALVDDLPVTDSTNWKELLPYRPVTRRALLQDDTGTPTKTVGGPQLGSLFFTIRASNVLTFLILVYFIGGTLYCVHSMKFKQDTLLYSREKLD